MRMLKLCAASMFILPLFILPVSVSQAEQPASVCGTGPYSFSFTTTGVLPSVRKHVAGLGLMAKMEDCSSFKVVCAIRPSTSADDKKLAVKESQTACGAIRSALLANSVSHNKVSAAGLNKQARDAVEITRVPATANFPAGSVLVYVKAQQ